MNKNTLEWTVFGISVALIAAVAGLLVHQQLTGGDAPPSVAVRTGRAVQTASGYAVPISVRNEGDVTAEDVRVEATLTWDGGREVGEAVFAFVPYHSERRAWIAFSRHPDTGTLQVRVLGYREP
jgi:uncharacterized protein (TIGR02588 family)